MDRREFLQTMAVTTAATTTGLAAVSPPPGPTQGYTAIAEFTEHAVTWKVHETCAHATATSSSCRLMETNVFSSRRPRHASRKPARRFWD